MRECELNESGSRSRGCPDSLLLLWWAILQVLSGQVSRGGVCRKGKEESIRALSSRRRGSGWVMEKEAANAVAGRKGEGERNGAQATTTQAEAGLGGRGEHTKRCGERVRGKKEERKEVRGDASEWCEACDGAEAKRERAPTQQHAHWDGRRRTDTKGRNSDSQRTRHNILITPRHNCKRVAL